MAYEEQAMDARPERAERSGEIHRLEVTLDRLNDEITNLEAVLDPVLGPETPHAMLSQEREQRSRFSDRVNRLEDLCGRLNYLRGRIDL